MLTVLVSVSRYRCLSLGLSFKTTMGSVLSLVPPLTITQSQMDEALDIVDVAITDAEAKFGYMKR